MSNTKRVVLGPLIVAARAAGVLLIALAILTFPTIRALVGSYGGFFDWLGSFVLLLVGIAWLFGLAWLIRFFDDALSRN